MPNVPGSLHFGIASLPPIGKLIQNNSFFILFYFKVVFCFSFPLSPSLFFRYFGELIGTEYVNEEQEEQESIAHKVQ